MYIGKVIGSVVSTIKIDHLESRKLLIVDQLDLEGRETGYYDIAVDVVQAGPGDTVMVIDEGNGARQILGLDPGAIRAVIVGVVDEVHLGEVADLRGGDKYEVSY
jgi:ethanolamine utilization protein EutN